MGTGNEASEYGINVCGLYNVQLLYCSCLSVYSCLEHRMLALVPTAHCRMQSSTAADLSLDFDEATPGVMVYVWTDWVQLYCQHLQDSIEDGVPVTEKYVLPPSRESD